MSKEQKNTDKHIPAKFKPRARLLLQLGDQLIKNESIALVELVKNSYDADANKVDIYMENVDNAELGVIIIEDDGYGMDTETVVNVWMEPGSDFKSIKFENRDLSPRYKRLPIGEKGIGRFGVHKLGNKIELTTKKKNCKEVFVQIDWTEFSSYKYLDQVPVTIVEREKPQHFKGASTGTNIVIRSLKIEWGRGVARNVKRTINSLVSPFVSNDSFRAQFDITDKPGWFQGLLEWKDVSHFSLFHFKATIKSSAIVDFNYEFTPWASMPKLSGRSVSTDDPLVKQFLNIEDENELAVYLQNYSIGEIIFEGYIFDRDSFLMRLGVTDKTGFKKYLDSNSGVRVFRDGLRVYDYGEPENDWLDLNLRRVNQPTKRLSKNILLGAVYLNRAESDDLKEKTNREGFIDNEAYQAFKKAILHTLNLIETLRFSDKQRIREIYGPTSKSEPVLHIIGELKTYVDKEVKEEPVRNQITKYLVKIEDDYKRVTENLLKAAGAGLSMSVVIHEVEKIILEVSKVLKSENASARAISLVKHLSSLIDGYAEIIRKSTQTNEDIKEVLDQAIFNTEYRLASHRISIIREYKKYTGKSRTKMARSLLIGSLMNVFDNSIYWLDRTGKNDKKIFINISDEEKDHLSIIIADNGTGFLLPTEEIIEPFVSSKPGGMGLGLHIASEIMLAQGGKLSFPDFDDFELPQEFKSGAILAFTFKK